MEEPKERSRPTQRALDWRVRAAFSGVFLAQANSVKMAFPCPSRQQVTHAVRCGQRNRINYPKPWSKVRHKECATQALEKVQSFFRLVRESFAIECSKVLFLLGHRT